MMIRAQLSHLQSDTDLQVAFPHWVSSYCDSDSIVLDVGAGEGISGNPAVIRQSVGRLVGVDPDATVMQNPYLDERYQATIENFAKQRTSSFDCIYMMFVLEHVTHPDEFLAACRSLLKPGGMLFGLTPNLWHHFGLATKLSASLKIEDWLLDHLIGTQAKSSYHFPTAYRLNSIRTLKGAFAKSGFREVEFRCFDQSNRYESYYPKPLQWFPSLYSRLVYTLGMPQIMGYIMCRATV